MVAGHRHRGAAVLFPLSLAYAVARHRVLDIPILLKRSARYVLVQRGFTFLLGLSSIALTLLFAVSFARRPLADTARAATIGHGRGVWNGAHVERGEGAPAGQRENRSRVLPKGGSTPASFWRK